MPRRRRQVLRAIVPVHWSTGDLVQDWRLRMAVRRRVGGDGVAADPGEAAEHREQRERIRVELRRYGWPGGMWSATREDVGAALARPGQTMP